jgi:RsiW-degrading membrane proteinase PrsW (M82 family)
MLTTLEWIILIIASFSPPLVYMVWIRNTEQCHRQTWGSILLAFLWGASIAVIAAIILHMILEISFAISFYEVSTLPLFAVVVIAPIAEEIAKPLGLRLKHVKRHITELEDGLIYGAVAGLGFSATENLFYGYSFFEEGIIYFIILISLRSIGGCLLHASATALTGYGYGKSLLKHTSWLRILPYFILAMIVHGAYNLIVSFQLPGVITGLAIAFFFVIVSISLIRKKIMLLDAKNC